MAYFPFFCHDVMTYLIIQKNIVLPIYHLYDVPFQSFRTIGHLVMKILHIKYWLSHHIKDRWSFPKLNVKYRCIFRDVVSVLT